jgi:hypothetical protein
MPSRQQLPGKLSIGIVMVFMAHLIPLLLLLVVAGGHWRPQRWPEMLLAIHASLSIAGALLCLTGRRAVKGTVYLFISISTSTSPLFLAVLTMLMRVPTWVTVAACLSPLPSTFFYILFLRRVAEYLERGDLRRLAGSMMFPATLSLIFVVTAIVPFVNLLTIPITTILLLITYALFLLLTYRTCWAAIAKPGRRTQIPESAPGRASKTTTM